MAGSSSRNRRKVMNENEIMKFGWDQYWEQQKDISLEMIIARTTWSDLTKRLWEPLNGDHSVKLLEAGCGSGSIALWLIENYKDIRWEVTLLDLSAVALSVAHKLAVKKGLEKRIKIIRGNILEMPFPDESFDLVINAGVMDHFDTGMRQKAFYQMARTTKANGKLMVIVPNALNPFYRIKKALQEYNGTWKYGFEKGFTFWELKRIFKSLNFTEIRTTGDSFLSDSRDLFGLILAAVNGRKIMSVGKGRFVAKINERFKIVRNSVKEVKRMIKYSDLTFSRHFGKILARNIGIIGRKKFGDFGAES
jgi:ubiquinone/menaquinone biosynthesis C-methylase UbiE